MSDIPGETTIEVDIASIAAGGDGVGRAEKMVVFVPRTVPGDRARVRVTPAKRFGRGVLESLVRPSESRVDPPCPHYTIDRCGGCQLQHISYAGQLAAKSGIIGDAIRRIGKRDVVDPVVTPSDSQWRYRRKLTLHVRWSGEAWIAGLHPFDDPVSVFDLRDCPITDERVLAVWAELRTGFEHLPRERALRVAVRISDDGASAVVEGGRAWPAHERFFAAAPSLTELWWHPQPGHLRRLSFRAGSVRGASFAQVNARVAAELRTRILERVRSYDPARVIDAYAGMGATSLPLSNDGRSVVAIELDGDAVEHFQSRLNASSRALVGRVEDHLSGQLPADVVLLNPPRAGVDALVTSALQGVRKPPRALFYISCDPATLARDLARMPRYRLAHVTAYDMFPQTAHVETVCELVPEDR